MIVPRAFRHRHGVTSPNPGSGLAEGTEGLGRTEKTPGPSSWRPEPSRAAPSKPILIRTRPSSHRKVARSSRDTLRSGPTSEPLNTHNHVNVSSARKRAAGNELLHEEIDESELGEAHAAISRRNGAPLLRSPTQPLSTSSPRSWELLQTPFGRAGIEDDEGSFDSDATASPFSSMCSLSSLSLDLADSERGGLTALKRTPESIGRRPRQKSLSSSHTEECGPDHPLSMNPDTKDTLEPVNEDELDGRIAAFETSSPGSKSFITSNLGASIRVLKSAAKSFSGLSASRRQQLTRSILSISPQFTDEKRPVLYDEVPEPALRRYLNPCHISPSEFHFHSTPEPTHSSGEKCTISVQLQSYYRPPSPSKNATTPAIFPGGKKTSEENDSLLRSAVMARPREPRENGDFLRIIVLEMNMRKAGKLGDSASGKARIWLPPRRVSAPAATNADSTVPERWVGAMA